MQFPEYRHDRGGVKIINPKTSQKSKGVRLQLVFTGLTSNIMMKSKGIRPDFVWLPFIPVSANKHHQIVVLVTQGN